MNYHQLRSGTTRMLTRMVSYDFPLDDEPSTADIFYPKLSMIRPDSTTCCIRTYDDYNIKNTYLLYDDEDDKTYLYDLDDADN